MCTATMECMVVALTISFLSLKHYRELLQPVLLSPFKLLLSRDRSWKTVALLCYAMHQCKRIITMNVTSNVACSSSCIFLFFEECSVPNHLVWKLGNSSWSLIRGKSMLEHSWHVQWGTIPEMIYCNQCRKVTSSHTLNNPPLHMKLYWCTVNWNTAYIAVQFWCI